MMTSNYGLVIMVFGLLILEISSFDKQIPPNATQKTVTDMVMNYVTANTKIFNDEIQSLYSAASDYDEKLRNDASRLMVKQTSHIKQAIQLAKKLTLSDCIERDFLPDIIISREYELIEDCEEVDDMLNEFFEETTEVKHIIEKVLSETKHAVSDCGDSYTLETTKVCVGDTAKRYRKLLFETYEINLKILRDEMEYLREGVSSNMMVCTIEARGGVLHESRLGAARIHACINNKELPDTVPNAPPIMFLKFPEPTPLVLHLTEVFDKNDYD